MVRTMAKKIRFPLEMDNGKEVRSIEEFRKHFSIEKALIYLQNGKLSAWLKDRYLDDIASAVESFEPQEADFTNKFCAALGVHYDNVVEGKSQVALKKVDRLATLKDYTDDRQYESLIDSIAFDDKELSALLDKGTITEIYLCGDTFNIPLEKEDVHYIGINRPCVVINSTEEVDWKGKNIVLDSVYFDKKYQDLLDAIAEKRKKKIEYCTNYIEEYSWHIRDDEKEGAIFVGESINSSGMFEYLNIKHIRDIDGKVAHWIVVDEKGKVHTWGRRIVGEEKQPDLPEIKQVAYINVGYLALDFEGKIHFWGNYSAGNWRIGNWEYKGMPVELPRIKQIGGARDLAFALDETGKLWTWGHKDSVEKIPTNLPRIKKVIAGDLWMYAMTENEDVIAWNLYRDTPTEYSIIYEGNPKVMDVALMYDERLLVLDENGKIHCLGKFGILSSSDVKKIENLNNIKRIFSSCDFVCMDKEGYLYKRGEKYIDQSSGKHIRLYCEDI